MSQGIFNDLQFRREVNTCSESTRLHLPNTFSHSMASLVFRRARPLEISRTSRQLSISFSTAIPQKDYHRPGPSIRELVSTKNTSRLQAQSRSVSYTGGRSERGGPNDGPLDTARVLKPCLSSVIEISTKLCIRPRPLPTPLFLTSRLVSMIGP